jgi:hypothetical protein
MESLLTVSDAAQVVSSLGASITPNGIRMAADRGQLIVAQRTRSGTRLFLLVDVIRYATARTLRIARRRSRRMSFGGSTPKVSNTS